VIKRAGFDDFVLFDSSFADGAGYFQFTIGDQLLWGAAEPLRRMLRILLAS
jgi:aspartate-semialdehyde dehydrogenase